MIEFGLKKRATNGKKSRCLRKFPRKRILHRGDEKAASWFRNNWIDDNYIYTLRVTWVDSLSPM